MRILSAHKKPIGCIAFSADGRLLAEGSDSRARVWDVAAAEIRHTFDVPGKFHNQVKVGFSPDGDHLVATNDLVHQIELATGARTNLVLVQMVNMSASDEREYLRFLRFIAGPDAVPGNPRESLNPFSGVSFSPDGRLLVAGENTWHMWDAESLQPVSPPTFPDPEGNLNVSRWLYLAFSADGRRLAAYRDGRFSGKHELFILDTANWTIRQTMSWNLQEARALRFSPDGRRVVALTGQQMRIWDTDSGQQVASVRGGKKHFMGAAFTADGRLFVSVSKDRTTRLWDTQNWTEYRSFDWDIGELLDVACAPDGLTVAVASNKGQILLFDVE
jgi:WD40 repeat protein